MGKLFKMPIEPITLGELPLVLPEFFVFMTMIQEAESEGPTGLQCVGEVIRKRTKNRIFSDGSFVSTVLYPYQFSGWNTKDPNRIRVAKMRLDDDVVLEAIRAWKRSKFSNLTLGATHYLNPRLVNPLPPWASPSNHVIDIGNHSFYIER